MTIRKFASLECLTLLGISNAARTLESWSGVRGIWRGAIRRASGCLVVVWAINRRHGWRPDSLSRMACSNWGTVVGTQLAL